MTVTNIYSCNLYVHTHSVHMCSVFKISMLALVFKLCTYTVLVMFVEEKLFRIDYPFSILKLIHKKLHKVYFELRILL